MNATASIAANPSNRARTDIPAVPLLSLRGVCKGYGSGASRIEVLEDLNLDVRAGEFVAIVGFSGSGKTTLARLITGLLVADAGGVTMGGVTIQSPSRERGLVFQNYSLLPWLTVRGNIALAVDRVFSSWSRTARREYVDRFIAMVGLAHAAHRRPHELSGGMRQRTSLAHTLATKPQLLVLDEPLSALDALTRGGLQDQILNIWQEERQSCVMITNDVDEALLMADRIIPLTPGPRAHLGPEFVVDIERPRDRTMLNHDARFQRLKNDVTSCLIEARQRVRRTLGSSGTTAMPPMPGLRPIHKAIERRAIFPRPGISRR